MQKGITADLSLPPEIETKIIPSLKEYSFTRDLLKKFPDTESLTEADIVYITSWILGISMEISMKKPWTTL